MRKYFLSACICLCITTIFAQQPAANPFPKTITVAGSAEMEIVPDEIYVNVVLQEYQKKGDDKKDIETLKTNFLAACKSAGIADSTISIVSYTGYNDYFSLRKRKKTNDLNASITYQIKFSSSKQMDDLVEKLDDDATRSFDIVNTSHSKMTEYRKQLKIEAVKAAKNKAVYLTEAINEKLGSAITINEPDETSAITARGSNGVYSQARVYNTNISVSNEMSDNLEVNFKKIKLRYEVTVIFSLQ